MDLSKFKYQFQPYTRKVIKEARSNLTRGDHNTSKTLYDSLDWYFKASKNSFEFGFKHEDYGVFVDQGVKGRVNTTKAPDSPYRFKSKYARIPAIKKWIRKRGFQFRTPKGRFMTYDSMAFLISRSIARDGLKATHFLSRPVNSANNRKLLMESLDNSIAELVDNTIQSAINN